MDDNAPLTAHEEMARAALIKEYDAAIDALFELDLPTWIRSAAHSTVFDEMRNLRTDAPRRVRERIKSRAYLPPQVKQ